MRKITLKIKFIIFFVFLLNTQFVTANVTKIIDINSEDFCNSKIVKFDVSNKALITVGEKIIGEQNCLQALKYDSNGNIIDSINLFCKDSNTIEDGYEYELYFANLTYFIQLSYVEVLENDMRKLHTYVFQLNPNDFLAESIETKFRITNLRQAHYRSDSIKFPKKYLATINPHNKNSSGIRYKKHLLISFKEFKDLGRPNIIKNIEFSDSLIYSFYNHAVIHKSQCKLQLINISTGEVISSYKDRFGKCDSTILTEPTIEPIEDSGAYNTYIRDTEQDFETYTGTFFIGNTNRKINRFLINSPEPIQHFGASGAVFSHKFRYPGLDDYSVEVIQIFPNDTRAYIFSSFQEVLIEGFSYIDNIVIHHSKLNEADIFSFLNEPPENALVFSSYCE